MALLHAGVNVAWWNAAQFWYIKVGGLALFWGCLGHLEFKILRRVRVRKRINEKGK